MNLLDKWMDHKLKGWKYRITERDGKWMMWGHHAKNPHYKINLTEDSKVLLRRAAILRVGALNTEMKRARMMQV